MSLFRQTRFRARCDRCHASFAPGHGGVCRQCRAILCDAHLHGSTFRKLLRELTGAAPVCQRCAAGSTVTQRTA